MGVAVQWILPATCFVGWYGWAGGGKFRWYLGAGENSAAQILPFSPGPKPCWIHFLIYIHLCFWIIKYCLPSQAVVSGGAASLHFLLLTFLIAQPHYEILNDMCGLNELMTEIKCDRSCKRPLRLTNTCHHYLLPIAAQRKSIRQ